MNPLFFKVLFGFSAICEGIAGLVLLAVWWLDALTRKDATMNWVLGGKLLSLWLVGLAAVAFVGWCVFNP